MQGISAEIVSYWYERVSPTTKAFAIFTLKDHYIFIWSHLSSQRLGRHEGPWLGRSFQNKISEEGNV